MFMSCEQHLSSLDEMCFNVFSVHHLNNKRRFVNNAVCLIRLMCVSGRWKFRGVCRCMSSFPANLSCLLFFLFWKRKKKRKSCWSFGSTEFVCFRLAFRCNWVFPVGLLHCCCVNAWFYQSNESTIYSN